MGARHGVGIGLSCRPARLQPASGIHSLELIPELHKRLKIRAQAMAFIYQILHILTPLFLRLAATTVQNIQYIYCSVRQQRVKNQSLVCYIIHSPEPVFVNVYGAQESILRNRFRSPPVRKIELSYRPARLEIDSWPP
jgi:hypothetical protein